MDNDKRTIERMALCGALAIGAALQIVAGADPGAVVGIGLFFGFLFFPRG